MDQDSRGESKTSSKVRHNCKCFIYTINIKLLDCTSEMTRAAVTVVHGLPPLGTILRMSRALSEEKQLFLLYVTQPYPFVVFTKVKSVVYWLSCTRARVILDRRRNGLLYGALPINQSHHSIRPSSRPVSHVTFKVQVNICAQLIPTRVHHPTPLPSSVMTW